MLLLPRLLRASAVVVVVVPVSRRLRNTKCLLDADSRVGDGASLAQNTDYGDGAMMTTAARGRRATREYGRGGTMQNLNLEAESGVQLSPERKTLRNLDQNLSVLRSCPMVTNLIIRALPLLSC